jgi:hypothetical protein
MGLMSDTNKPSTNLLQKNLIDAETVLRDATEQSARAVLERMHAERLFINAACSLTIRRLERDEPTS